MERDIRKLIVIAGIVLLGICSCKPKLPNSQPVDFDSDSVLIKDSLELLMIDVFLIEAAIYKKQVEGKDIKQYSSLYYNWLFNKYKIDRNRILKSIEYYISQQQMELIMEEVVNSITEIDIQTIATQDTTQANTKKPAWIEKMTGPEAF